MIAFDIGCMLLCPECGQVMYADQYNKRDPRFEAGTAFWQCLSPICTLHGKRFAQKLQTVSLTEVEPCPS